ncbi:MAG: DNA repair protein RecN, partial [Alphaproteobacteria bacterium]|nr:DNA repair protein RecN [Alphaproteobacteria bacterium]
IENDIVTEGEVNDHFEIILRRTLNKDGKNKSFINDIPVSLSTLKLIGDTLIEIHGQFDNQSLLNPATHINILDNFAHDAELKEECRVAYQNWQKVKCELKTLEENFAKAKEDEDYLKHNLMELETLNPQKGEEEELNNKRHILMNSEKIITSIKDAFEYLSKYGDEPEKFITNANYALERIPDDAKNENINSIISELENATSNISDAYERLKQILSENDGDTSTLEATEERLFSIRELARKHKVTPDELPEFMVSLKRTVDNINNSDEVLNEKKVEEQKAKETYLGVANKLSDVRSDYARMLSEKVMMELPPLKLEKATFEVVVSKETDENKFSANGINSVCFMGSTNFGGVKNYIHKIASGGELARFTLAIKVVISDASIISSMIFDEVDTGISGATASAVGERLARLSRAIQILVVTHSPQVASFGNHHFKVSKYFDAQKNATITSVEQLSEPQRVNEIARIISGDKITPEAVCAAEKLFITSVKA